jgi:very-short-patch-repair endonuclease
MSYTNQHDHELLDRKAIHDLLMRLASVKVEGSSVALPRAQHLETLLRQCQSDLERAWLHHLEERDLRLPSRAQHLIEQCRTQPDFLYEGSQTAIYVDGPHHTYPERKARDREQTACLEDLGFTVLRFGDPPDWDGIIDHHPNIFGKRP